MGDAAESYLISWSERDLARADEFIELGELSFFVPQKVFSPDPELTHSTSSLLEAFPATIDGRMLDLGTGCGVLAIHAAKRGAQVVASDYDEVALQAARKNVKLHNAGEQVVVMQSDLLESISGKFSLIVANLPIVDSAWSGLAHSVKGQMKRLLEDLPEYLEPNGRCLVSFASFGNMPLFLELLKNQPLAYRESCQEKFGVSWSVFELRMR